MNSVTKTSIKFQIRRMFPNRKKREQLKTQLHGKGKKALLMNTPCHGNLGDQAIALAEIVFLEKYYPEYQIVEVPSDYINHCLNDLRKNISEEDLIFVQGGGNFGNLYIVDEAFRRLIAKTFKKNKIISFPQSIEYTSDSIGERELGKAQQLYSQNSNFILSAREPVTKNFINKQFPKNEHLIAPDIVISMAPLSSEFTDQIRNGAVSMLRKDKEKAIADEFSNEITKYLEENYSRHTVSDTITSGSDYINSKNRFEKVSNKWLEIGQHELAVTDRLHGMIFCYLTKTPCVVLKNNNKKIESTYDYWLKDCNFIQLLEENKIEDLIDAASNVTKQEPQYLSGLNEKFSPLKEFNGK